MCHRNSKQNVCFTERNWQKFSKWIYRLPNQYKISVYLFCLCGDKPSISRIWNNHTKQNVNIEEAIFLLLFIDLSNSYRRDGAKEKSKLIISINFKHQKDRTSKGNLFQASYFKPSYILKLLKAKKNFYMNKGVT